MNRPEKFFTELKALCEKYKVSIIASDDGRPYGMHSSEVQYDFDYMEEDYGKIKGEVIDTYFTGETDIKELLE